MRNDSTMLKERVDLKTSPLFSSFAVKDIDTARDFYRGTLGLDVRDDTQMGILEIHGQGGTTVMVYPKPDHKPAVFTVLNLPVKNLEGTVDGLIAAGVPFEHYDGKDAPKTDAKGISVGQGPRIAWFRDPDGNILSVMDINPA
jgi:catechol 2,3-dioxygenase-like lactoylglutathione lyase family enzyme